MPRIARIYLIFIGVSFLLSCRHSERLEEKLVCDFDNYNSEKKYFLSSQSDFVVNEGTILRNSGGRFNSSCIALLPNDPRGIKFTIPQVKMDEVYKISVWRRGKGAKASVEVKAGEGQAKVHEICSNAISTDGRNWEKLVLEYIVAPHLEGRNIQVYLSNQGLDTVFFDDLEIENISLPVYPRYGHENTLYIYIDTIGLSFLNRKRSEFFKQGFLVSDSMDNVPTIFFTQGAASQGKIRLKGQEKEQFLGLKWGMRLDLGQQAWDNMTEFSFASPEIAGMADEVFMHRWLAREGLLSTRNGIVPVAVNSKGIGAMMYEEEFEPSWFYFNNRFPGLLFHFSDEAWIKAKSFDKNSSSMQFFMAADMEIYSKNKTEKLPAYSSWITMANNLVFQWKNNFQPAHVVFDADKLARLLAITDISRSWGSLRWGNLKVYYNPLNEKLELIGQDFKVDKDAFPPQILCLAEVLADSVLGKGISSYFISDEIVNKKYLACLHRFSSEAYLDSIQIQISQQVQTDLGYLKKEYPEYRFDFQKFRDQARAIRNRLKELNRAPVKTVLPENLVVEWNTSVSPHLHCDFVKIYPENSFKGKKNIFIRNFLPVSIRFKGTGTDRNVVLNAPKKEMTIAPYSSLILYDIPQEHAIYFFNTLDLEDDFVCQESFLPAPKNFGSLQSVRKNYLYAPTGKKQGDQIIRFEGKVIVRKPIFIPSGTRVEIKPGTSFDFLNRSFLFSESPILALGNENNTIEFGSSDNTGQGLVIMNCQQKSRFVYCYFKNLDSPVFKGWSVPGAVNLVNTKAILEHSEFINGISAAALFLSGSEMEFDRSQINLQNGKAIQAYFSNLKVTYSIFNQSNMEAFHLLSSVAQLDTCSIFECNTGLLADINSRVNLNQSMINSAATAIVSDNGSLIHSFRSTVKECRLAIVVKNTSQVYLPGQFVSNHMKMSNNQNNFFVESGATLNYNGNIVDP